MAIHSRVMAGLTVAAALTMSACGSSLQSTVERLEASMRTPGETLVRHPDRNFEEDSCGQAARPVLRLEAYELKPSTIRPGERFNHRIGYTFCPSTPGAVLTGELRTNIIYESQVVARDEVPYSIKPGRWIVDKYIVVPETSPLGIYFIETEFSGGGMSLKRGGNLAVVKG